MVVLLAVLSSLSPALGDDRPVATQCDGLRRGGGEKAHDDDDGSDVCVTWQDGN